MKFTTKKIRETYLEAPNLVMNVVVNHSIAKYPAPHTQRIIRQRKACVVIHGFDGGYCEENS